MCRRQVCRARSCVPASALREKDPSGWYARLARLARSLPQAQTQGATEPPGPRAGRRGLGGAGTPVGLCAAPGPKITATTAPTLATSPTLKRMSVSVPVVVDGTSIEVLSVSISKRLSPGFTASPAALNHFVILPSATVSPSCGIRTSTRFIPSLSSPNRRAAPDLTSSQPRIASREIPSCLHARLRGRGRIALYRQREPRDPRRVPD